MKKFNSYLIDDVKSESEVQVLMEMTELLLKQYEMSNYYYMEAVEPSKGNNPVDQPVTTPATQTPATPPTAKPSAPAKQPTGDLTSNPSANNTNTSNQQQKPEEQKGFIGFIKKIGNAISNWVKKIIDFITGNNKKKTEESINNLENAVVQTKEVVGNDEQSKEKLEGLASSNKFDEFLEKMGFKNINFEKVKKIAIEAITRGTITSVIATELRALVSGLVLIAGTDIAAKEAGADPLTTAEKGVVIAETHKAVWITDFKNKLEGIISFVQKTGTEATLTIEQFKETFKTILDKLNLIKPIMEKIQQHTQEKVQQSEGDKADDSAKSDTEELAETLETCKKTFWLITFIQNIGNAILALIQYIGDLFKKDKEEEQQQSGGEGGTEADNMDYSAMVEKDETYQPDNDGQTSDPSQFSTNVSNPMNQVNQTTNLNGSEKQASPQELTEAPPEPVQPPQQTDTPPKEPQNPQPQQTVQQSTQNDSSQPQGEGSIDYKIATDENELKNYAEDHDVNFYTPGESLAGEFTVRDDNNMPARGSISVIDGKAYPNALYYKNLTNGQTSQSHVENLKNLFDFENVGNNKTLPPLKSIIPAIIDDRRGPDNAKLIRRGKLIF